MHTRARLREQRGFPLEARGDGPMIRDAPLLGEAVRLHRGSILGRSPIVNLPAARRAGVSSRFPL